MDKRVSHFNILHINQNLGPNIYLKCANYHFASCHGKGCRYERFIYTWNVKIPDSPWNKSQRVDIAKWSQNTEPEPLSRHFILNTEFLIKLGVILFFLERHFLITFFLTFIFFLKLVKQISHTFSQFVGDTCASRRCRNTRAMRVLLIVTDQRMYN